MLATYLVVVGAYVFSLCAAIALITAINHLDPKDNEPIAAPEAPRELKLAS